jgi:hypothetical protein
MHQRKQGVLCVVLSRCAKDCITETVGLDLAQVLAQLFLNGTAIVPKWGIVSVRPLQ